MTAVYLAVMFSLAAVRSVHVWFCFMLLFCLFILALSLKADLKQQALQDHFL